MIITRRHAIKTAALAGAALATVPGAIAQPNPAAPAATAPTGPFTLPALPYAYDALEPHIDAQTMQIHHDKHHAAYVANLNKAVADFPDLGKKPVEDLLKDLNAVPEKIRTAVRNNGGGHYNHSLFWQMMKKGGGGEVLLEAVETAEILVDGPGQLTHRLAVLILLEQRPEERVVGMPAAVVADLDARRFRHLREVCENLIYAHSGDRRQVGDRRIEVGHIRGVVLVVVNLHGLGVNERLQSIISITQRRKFEGACRG